MNETGTVKPATPLDQLAQDIFRVPDCISTPGTMPALQPRPMPSLRVACPAREGAAQRYRDPLWRAFKGGP